MKLGHIFLFSLAIITLSMVTGFIACDEEEDDDDDSDDNDSDDDSSGGTEADCLAQFGEDQLDCAGEVTSSTRKEGAACVITSSEDLVSCLESVGACSTVCDCIKGCNSDARDCIDPCGDDEDTCLDACNDSYDACLIDCDFQDLFPTEKG